MHRAMSKKLQKKMITNISTINLKQVQDGLEKLHMVAFSKIPTQSIMLIK
jgi:hypothetical protein